MNAKQNSNARALSALPSVGARVVAFIGILIAGFAGALLGVSLIDLQCQGSCAGPNSVGLVSGAVISAAGMSVVVVLVLRAVGEWRELDGHK